MQTVSNSTGKTTIVKFRLVQIRPTNHKTLKPTTI